MEHIKALYIANIIQKSEMERIEALYAAHLVAAEACQIASVAVEIARQSYSEALHDMRQREDHLLDFPALAELIRQSYSEALHERACIADEVVYHAADAMRQHEDHPARNLPDEPPYDSDEEEERLALAEAIYKPFRDNSQITQDAYIDACKQVYKNLPRYMKGLHFERDASGSLK